MLPVCADVNVLVGAVATGADYFNSWPSPPPIRGNYRANVVGILNDGREFSLFLSEHILVNVTRVLVGQPPNGYGWDVDRAQEYVELLADIAVGSGGAVVEPDVSVTDCDDYEDNRILELAYASNAALIVSDDEDLLRMNPWRGIPIIDAREFVNRTDAMRRARRP